MNELAKNHEQDREENFCTRGHKEKKMRKESGKKNDERQTDNTDGYNVAETNSACCNDDVIEGVEVAFKNAPVRQLCQTHRRQLMHRQGMR